MKQIRAKSLSVWHTGKLLPRDQRIYNVKYNEANNDLEGVLIMQLCFQKSLGSVIKRVDSNKHKESG